MGRGCAAVGTGVSDILRLDYYCSDGSVHLSSAVIGHVWMVLCQVGWSVAKDSHVSVLMKRSLRETETVSIVFLWTS